MCMILIKIDLVKRKVWKFGDDVLNHLTCQVFMYDGVEFMMMTKVELYLFENYKIVFIFDYI